MLPFLFWLNTQCEQVRALEGKAKVFLDANDAHAWRELMREKAELLAGLAAAAADVLPSLPAGEQQRAAAQLRRFSQSAATALSLNSPFYMSALLYPEDSKDGDPNDLERFRDSFQ